MKIEARSGFTVDVERGKVRVKGAYEHITDEVVDLELAIHLEGKGQQATITSMSGRLFAKEERRLVEAIFGKIDSKQIEKQAIEAFNIENLKKQEASNEK